MLAYCYRKGSLETTYCHTTEVQSLPVDTVRDEKLCVPHGDFCSFSGIKFASGIEDFGDLFPLPPIIMQLQLWNPTFLVLNPRNSHNPGTSGFGGRGHLSLWQLLLYWFWPTGKLSLVGFWCLENGRLNKIRWIHQRPLSWKRPRMRRPLL